MAKDKKKKDKGFVAEFKKFIMRGNVMDMAVGVIVGGAFTAIVTSLNKDILTPILGIFGGIDAHRQRDQRICPQAFGKRTLSFY